MKSILYVGATLMIGASIYGFVDYKKTSQSKEFTGLYEEKKATPEVTIPEKKIETGVAEKKADDKTVAKKQTRTRTKKLSSIKPIKEEEMLGKTEVKDIPETTVDTKIADNSTPEKKLKKKRKLNRNMFSRAPIREEQEDPIKEKPVVKSDKKDLNP